MFIKIFKLYINNFKGFSREIWILTFITFINRAGTMVVPFLSKYLKDDLHFSYSQIGTVMVCFGVGSVCGSWLGGKLSDKFGFYKLMTFSLFTSGLVFFGCQFITDYYQLCFAMFLLMVIADMFRPAMFVSLNAYSTPETRTKALTLVRLAVNLGFASGPALGGLIIMSLGYKSLFWVDGATCIIAILIFRFLVKEKKVTKDTTINLLPKKSNSVFKDIPFLVFLASCLTIGVMFFQLFSTLPLYQSIQFRLTEFQIGLLLTLNGGLIFFLEMVLVNYVEKHKVNKVLLNTIGCFFMTISMFLLTVNTWAGILIIMMVFMTFGEMFSFPFSNSFAMSRAPKGSEGKFMGVFTMSFSMAHIISSKLGLDFVEAYGYTFNWVFMGILGLIGTLLSYITYVLVQKEALKLKK